MIKIALDVHGGDLPQEERIRGVLLALKSQKYLNVILVGNRSQIQPALSCWPAPLLSRISYHHTEELMGMGDSPSLILKQKKNSSLALSVGLVKINEAQAVVSAGNTGAQMAASLFQLGRIASVERPAIATTVPSANGSFVLLDAGANTDVKAKHLLDYAEMGKIFSQKIYQKPSPLIGLLNNGTEEEKGSKLTKEVFQLLKTFPGFYGFIEGREMMQGLCDVIICDGFTGNIALKTIEGVANTLIGMLKKELMSSIKNKIAALMLRSSLKHIKSILDYRTYGGAPLLGVKGISIICHGSSDALAIQNALLLAYQMHKVKLIECLVAG